MLKKWLAIYFYLLLALNISKANNGFYAPITSIQGLSQNQVRCILQDKKGFLWIGTQDGLNQYDGYEFKKYSRIPFDKNSLSSDFVNALMEDDKERLWIGTIGGLDLLDKSRSAFINLSHLINDNNTVPRVRSITQLNVGQYNITTSSEIYNVAEIDGVFRAKRMAIENKDLRISKGVKDDQHNMWYATNRGLHCLFASKNKLFKIDKTSNENITDLFCDKANNIWYLANNNLYKYESAINKLTKINIGLKATSLFIDHMNELWIGTIGQGLYSTNLDAHDYNVEDLNLKLNAIGMVANLTISSIYESDDKYEDIIWLGSTTQGLLQYSRSKNSFENLHEIIRNKNPEASSYFAIYTDDDLLYAGTDNGIFSLNMKNDEVVRIKVDDTNEKSNQLQDILKDSKNNLWLGTNNGLYVKKSKKPNFTKMVFPSLDLKDFAVYKIKEDNNQQMWVGTSNGILKMDQSKTIAIDTLIINGTKEKITTVGALAIDTIGNLWIGTTKGIYVQNIHNTSKYIYQPDNKNGLIENVINDIFVNKKGEVWIATPKGLSKAIKGKDNKITFEHFTEKDGLFNSYVYGILEDAIGHLWLSTNKGLFDFDPYKKTFKWYGATDGLTNEEFNSGAFHSDNKGNMYFGGINLLVKFKPQQIVHSNHLPKVCISEVKVDDNIINIRQGRLSIKHNAHLVSLKLAALDFTNPQNNLYAYRIKGLQSEWIHLKNQRIINLFNLPYGDNSIEVKASNNEGVWNENNFAQLTITVESPFWRRQWFYGLMLAFVTSAIYAIHKSRLNSKLTMERIRLEENERVRKIASQDLHDDFGNSLTRISILTEMIKSKIDQHKFVEANDLLLKIADNANRLYQGTKDFIWSIRADSENLFEAIVRIKDYAEDLLAMSEISFTESALSANLKKYNLPPASSRHIVMIMKEAIMNTLKHSNASAAHIAVNVTQNKLILSWSDNGKGLPSPIDNAKGNGLENMKSRANTIKANIEVQSDINHGTTIILTIPIREI